MARIPILLMLAAVLAAVAPSTAAAGNTWSVAADNVQAPGHQSAILLRDGRFTATGPMTRARAVFTLTPLQDGTVLAADCGQTDLYDPEARRLTHRPRRCRRTSTRSPRCACVTAGCCRSGARAAIPRPRRSTCPAPGRPRRASTGATIWPRGESVPLADGRVLVVGGSGHLRFVETWDPQAMFWTNTGPLFNARTSNFGLVRLDDGRVLVDGGAQPDEWCDNEGGGCEVGPVHPAEIYTP